MIDLDFPLSHPLRRDTTRLGGRGRSMSTFEAMSDSGSGSGSGSGSSSGNITAFEGGGGV